MLSIVFYVAHDRMFIFVSVLFHPVFSRTIHSTLFPSLLMDQLRQLRRSRRPGGLHLVSLRLRRRNFRHRRDRRRGGGERGRGGRTTGSGPVKTETVCTAVLHAANSSNQKYSLATNYFVLYTDLVFESPSFFHFYFSTYTRKQSRSLEQQGVAAGDAF